MARASSADRQNTSARSSSFRNVSGILSAVTPSPSTKFEYARRIPKKPKGPPPLEVPPPPPRLPVFRSLDTGVAIRLHSTRKMEKCVLDEVTAMENRLSRLRVLESRTQFKENVMQRHEELVKQKRQMDEDTRQKIEEARRERDMETQARITARRLEREKREDFRVKMEGLFVTRHKEAMETKVAMHSLRSVAAAEEDEYAQWVREEARLQREKRRNKTEQSRLDGEARAVAISKMRHEEKTLNEQMINESRQEMQQRRRMLWDSIHATKAACREQKEQRRVKNKEVVVSLTTAKLNKKEGEMRRLKEYMDAMRQQESHLLSRIAQHATI